MMSRALLSFICVLCVSQIVHPATISEVNLKIIATQRYLSNEVSRLRTEIPAAITVARSVLRNRAEAIKGEIRAGPSSCQFWIKQIDSTLQHQINFEFTFRDKSGEIFELERTKYSLQDMAKDASQLFALCKLVRDCQRNIDSLYSGVLAIESNIGIKSAAIFSSSDSSISGKSAAIDKSMDDVYKYWKTCTEKQPDI